MENQFLQEIMTYNNLFPDGVRKIELIKKEEICNVVVEAHNNIEKNKFYRIRILYNNKDYTDVIMYEEEDVIETINLLSNLHLQPQQLMLYAIMTRSTNNNRIPDFLTYNNQILIQAIKHLT